MTTNGTPSAAVSVKQLPPRITPASDNHSTLSMDRRSVAAHPWHDLEIGKSRLSECSHMFQNFHILKSIIGAFHV
jgi:hypothetical protein